MESSSQNASRERQGSRQRLLQAGLLTAGVALLLVASTFLIGESWDGTQPPGAAAGSGVDGLATGQEPGTDESAAFAWVNAGALGGEPAILPAESAPRETPMSPRTPAGSATATPSKAAGAPQAAAPPEQAVAPQPAVPTRPAAVAPTAAPRATATPVAPPASCPTASMAGFGLALFNAINSERVQQGMATLSANACVVYVAQVRSDDMASRGYFAHTSPEGVSAFSLLDSNSVRYGWAGENLARNNYPDDQTVAVAIRDLMASEGHRANILNPHYTQMGVAVAFDGAGMKYYTMLFIGPP